jgi:hypothetical protein
VTFAYIQWALADPGDWEPFTVADWAQLPRRPEPQAGQMGGQDDVKGWAVAVDVCGMVYEMFDRLTIVRGVGPQAGAVFVHRVGDDPDDWPVGRRWAMVDEIRMPRPDPRFGGAVNTWIRQTVYAEADYPYGGIVEDWTVPDGANGVVARRPFADYAAPNNAGQTRHMFGVWLTDSKYREHQQRRTVHNWRDWIGVD